MPRSPNRPDRILWQGPFLGVITGYDVKQMADKLIGQGFPFTRAFRHTSRGLGYLIIQGWAIQPEDPGDVPSDAYLDALIHGETKHAAPASTELGDRQSRV